MYQKPQLNRVGEAQDVILGIMPSGNDMDMNWVPGGNEWASDESDGE